MSDDLIRGGKVLPPLDYFVAFEAAAKAQSFSKASNVLNVSETAISRKVRLLEQHYGVSLFRRGHRSISLTRQGETLLETVETAINLLRAVSRELLLKYKNNPVTLAATNSVATLWLMPHLRMLSERDEDLGINLVASDNDEECLSETVDLAILRGDGEWAGFDAQLLFGETVFPVCSHAYLERIGGVVDLALLPTLELIEVNSKHSEWMNWRKWFEAIGYPRKKLDTEVSFNTYPLAIQAAVDGFGVALGWGHLVDMHLEAGSLVRLMPDHYVRTNSGYYLLKHRNYKAFSEVDRVEDWLLDLSARRKRFRTC